MGIWGENGTFFHNLFNHWKQWRSRSLTSVHRLSCEQPRQSTHAEGRAWPLLNIISVDLYGLLQCNDCWFWALIACVWQKQKGSEVYYCFDTVSKGKLFTSILIQPFVNTQQRKNAESSPSASGVTEFPLALVGAGLDSVYVVHSSITDNELMCFIYWCFFAEQCIGFLWFGEIQK